MTESEMLKYAARANGYIDDAATADDGRHDQCGLHKGVDGVFYLVSEDGWGPWAPRTNSGHAFELAMNCRMAVCCGVQSCAAGVGNQHRSPIKDGDKMAAAREAVFMAAAELGKAMP